MKITVFLSMLFVILSGSTLSAQELHYERDSSGNRVSRSIVSPVLYESKRILDDESLSSTNPSQIHQPLLMRESASNDIQYYWVLDTRADVGEIPMFTGVMPNGMAVVQVPLITGPSDGSGPSLSLSYSSYAGNGVAGYGWDLSGIPSISLINKNQYYHHTSEAAVVGLTSSMFALDGQYLIANNLALENNFALRVADDQILVNPHKNVAGQVLYFTAAYPDGSSAVFGFIDNDQPRKDYPLTKMTDRFGAETTYSYALSDNEYRIVSINHNDGSIIFGYEANIYAPEEYRASLSCKRAFHIKSIVCLNKTGQILAQYKLSYILHEDARILKKIELLTSAGHYLNPLTFQYVGETDPSYPFASFENQASLGGWFPNARNMYYLPGKFINGVYDDGLLYHPAYKNYKYFTTYYGTDYPEDLVIPLIKDVYSGYVSHRFVTDKGFQTIQPADIDGDGVDEVIRVNYSHAGSQGTSFMVYVYGFTDNGTVALRDSISAGVPAAKAARLVGYSPIQCRYEFGDFLGQGYQQLMIIPYLNGEYYDYPSDRDYKLCLVDLKNKTSQYVSPSTCKLKYYAAGDNVYCMDIDSDGKCEIVNIGEANVDTNIYVFDPILRGLTIESRSTNPDPISEGRMRMLTDLNSDGYIDMLLSPVPGSGDTSWSVNYYTGTTFTPTQSIDLVDYLVDDKVVFKDVNDDGYPDFLRLRNATVGIRINDHGHFSNTMLYQTIIPAEDDENVDLVPMPSSGLDNRCFALGIKGNEVISIAFSWDRGLHRKMDYAIGSLGTATKFSYQDIRYNTSRYIIAPSSLRNGYHIGNFSLQPVTTMYTAHRFGRGAEQVSRKDYIYTNAVISTQGLGFCGFQKVKEVYAPKGVSTRTSFAPDRHGAVLSTEIFLTSDDTPLSTQTNTYLDVPTSYGRAHPRLRTQYSRNHLDDTYTHVDSIRYDATFELPTWTRTKTGYVQAGTLARTAQKSITYRNSLAANNYIVGMPITESTVNTSSVLPGMLIDIASYTYNAANLPVVISRTRGDGASPPVQMQRDSLYYDTHGNVIRRASAQYGSAVYNAESYTYDSAHHSRLLSSTDAIGHTTTYSDFDNRGRPRQSTDWRGRTSSVQYDAWGNAIGSTAIDGTTSATVSAWGGDGLYTVTNTGSGAPISIAHYNDLGQNTLSEQQRFDGSMLKVRKRYDNLGRISAESLPFKDELLDEPAYTTYTYDEYSRPTSVASPGGRGRVWTYDDAYTTTVTEDGISRTTAINPYTLHQTSTDGALTAEITPAIDGQTALAVVYPVGSPERELSRTEYGYDKYGRLIRENNTYTGERTYSYTNLADGGMSVTESNPNGSIITDVDRYGRTTSVARSGEGAFTSAYSYNALGQLTGVSNTAEGASSPYNSESYTYDVYDRPASVTVNNGSNRYFTRQYSYNSNGQLSSIRYTSQNGDLGVEGRTYANGHLKSYKYRFYDDPLVVAKNIWTLQEENSHGQPTRATSGPLTREYRFDYTMSPAGRRLRLTSGTSASSGPFIQKETYLFRSSDGNLGYRLVESGIGGFYRYDNLNRLTQDPYGSYAYNDAGDPSVSVRNGTLQYGSVSRVHGETGVINPADTVATRTASQSLLYSAYRRPTSLEVENPNLAGDIQAATFRYNQNLERCSVSNQHVTPASPLELPEVKYYAGGCYEGYTLGIRNINKEVVYLGGTYYSAPAAVVIQNGAKTLYFIGRDYQGSITHLIAEDGTVVEQTEYDSWGLPRRTLSDGTTLDAYRGDDVPLLLGRGYTGHEHLQWAGLINMNARLYDPFTGRFLSPDPVLQDPLNPQTYNPYNYCLNNPLKYTDESGEFFVLDSFLVGLIGGGWDRAKQMAFNDLKIWGGLFISDKNKSFKEQVSEIFSRLTKQLPQTLIGLSVALSVNIFHGIESVEYLHGATVSKHYKDFGGITFGSYIMGDKDIEAKDSNDLFQHEFGHYLQSQESGWRWLFDYAIESGISALLNDYNGHARFYTEQDANIRSLEYMLQHYGKDYAAKTWKLKENPIETYIRPKPYIHISNISSLQFSFFAPALAVQEENDSNGVVGLIKPLFPIVPMFPY